MADSGKIYDLAIVGGGIAGVAVARDAAQRGLSVILFEKNTLGSGASSKSSKLIHGGIRYLELAWQDLRRLHLLKAYKNFRFVLSSLKEAQTLAKIAPGIVHPIRLFVPIYRNRNRGPAAVYCGTLFYGWLSRLAGNPSSPQLFGSPEKALKALPILKSEGLQGAVEITDHTADDRALVEAVAHSAVRYQAQIIEHALVVKWKKSAEGIIELLVSVKDQESTVRAKAVVNASGAWIDKMRGASSPINRRYVFPVGGSHIELPAFLGRSAILEARDGRVFFVVEKNNRARVGTTEWPAQDAEPVMVPPADIDYLLESLTRYFPSKKWSREDILESDAGLRPLAVNRPVDNTSTLSREHAVRIDGDGIFHLAGVKLTDHRRAAEETVDLIFKMLGRKNPGCRTGSLTL